MRVVQITVCSALVGTTTCFLYVPCARTQDLRRVLGLLSFRKPPAEPRQSLHEL